MSVDAPDLQNRFVSTEDFIAGEVDGEVLLVPTSKECRAVLTAMIGALAETFDDAGAVNYVEYKLRSPKHGDMAFSIQKVSGKTPHELRAKADQQLAEMKAAIRECVGEIYANLSGLRCAYPEQDGESGDCANWRIGKGCAAECPLVRLRELAGIDGTVDGSMP